MNVALVSGKLVKKAIFTRANGKRAVRFSIENIVCSNWGNEVVQFKSVIYCVAFGGIARVVWYDINPGERIFVTGRLEWKPVDAQREDKNGVTYGVQSVVASDIVRMRGEPAIQPTWSPPDDPRPNPADQQEPAPVPPVRHSSTNAALVHSKANEALQNSRPSS